MKTEEQLKRERECKYRWAKNNPEKVRASARKWANNKNDYFRTKSAKFRKRNTEKKAAWDAVGAALRRGKLLRPDHCENCMKICRPEAHHEDYSKWLEVRWLCRKCHEAETRKKAA